MKKILMAALALGSMSSIAYAGSCIAESCTGKITALYMTSTGTLYVGTDGDETALTCGGVAGVYMSLKEGDVGKNAMYSLLLTAKTTGKEVTIKVDTASDCRVLFIKEVS